MRTRNGGRLASLCVLLTVLATCRCGAQIAASSSASCVADPQLPAFEVASIRPVAPQDRGATTIGQYGQSRFTLRGASLSLLLSFSFDIQPQNFIDASHGLEDAVFDVQVASVNETPLTYEALKPRMQQMLEQRFCLKATVGTKQVAGYALVIAKSGPKLKPAIGPTEPGSGYITQHEVSGTSMDMRALALMLASPAGRPVQDQTGLQGKYMVKVQFASLTDSESTLPSIFTAVKEQLGLELKPAQVPVPTLKIDRLNLTPSEN